MPGLATYPSSNKVVSAMCGYSALQAGVQGYLTTATITAATGADDLVTAVQAAVVAPGAESPAQRQNIIAAIREGARLGDWSDARVQGATTPQSLAELTWVTDDPAYANGHLGPSFFG